MAVPPADALSALLAPCDAAVWLTAHQAEKRDYEAVFKLCQLGAARLKKLSFSTAPTSYLAAKPTTLLRSLAALRILTK